MQQQAQQQQNGWFVSRRAGLTDRTLKCGKTGKATLCLGVGNGRYEPIQPNERAMSKLKLYFNMTHVIKGVTVPRTCMQWLQCHAALQKELQARGITTKALSAC
jgi:hypothetical protein